MTPLELATGVALGLWSDTPPLPRHDPDRTVRQVVDDVVLEALLRPPCLVTFSGGRDSSAILAVAAHVAHREGLPPPLPYTLRFPAVETSNEDDWQESLIDRLGLREQWVIHTVDDEADCVGPWALEVQRRVGLVWPFNTHFFLPMLRSARGGTLLTGVGGDEMLSPAPVTSVARLLVGRRRPHRGDAKRIVRATAPRTLRVRLARRTEHPPMPWLTRAAQSQYNEAKAVREATAPLSWAKQLAHYTWPSRHIQVARSSLAALADAEGTHVLHPFEEPRVVAALAHHGGFAGLGGRTQMMQSLFGDVLPESHISRRTKAWFNLAFWNRHARAMAAAWDGAGLDTVLVNAEGLAAEWRKESPDGRSRLLLQHLARAVDVPPPP